MKNYSGLADIRAKVAECGVIVPMRAARTLGMWTKENGVKANIPDGDRSIYDCSKYAPLIDVDFRISQHCCNVMKKSPMHTFERQSGKKGITAQMATESRLRTQQWLNTGCNGFTMKNPKSNPMSFWTEQDVLQYIRDFKIPIASVYGDIVFAEEPEQMRIEFDDGLPCGRLCTTGCDRTGCVFCGFGAHLEKGETRFQRLKRTHPRQYEYCIGGGAYDEDGLWKPNKDGLGMGHVFDELNKIYGENFLRYN